MTRLTFSRLLDQAWSASPINVSTYFHNWATTRYSNATQGALPAQVYQTWDLLLHSVYNNTNVTAAQAVTKSIFELAPNATGLLNRTGHHPTTITYNTSTLVKAWQTFISAANATPSLWDNEAYQFDLIDITRQVLANAFNPLYSSFVAQTNLTAIRAANTSAVNVSLTAASHTQSQILSLLTTINQIVCLTPSSVPESSLQSWVSAARAWADSNSSVSDFYAYDAVNQVTLWGPTGQISDYASRQWCGLVSGYYLPRWQMFTDTYLNSLTTGQTINQTQLQIQLLTWEEQQEVPLASVNSSLQSASALPAAIRQIEAEWCQTLGC